MKSTSVIAAAVSLSLLCPIQAATRPTTRAEAVPSDDKLILAFPGKPGPIPYEKLGHFDGVGTAAYRYAIDDRKGLAEAAGEGIFPNNETQKDPTYKKLVKDGKLAANQWKYVDTNASALNFYKWATTSEDPGVKQFFAAIMLERVGLLEESIKAFYAVAVHFPKTISYTYYDTPWYVGPASIDRIIQLLRRHPEIKMELQGGYIDIPQRFDNDVKNDQYLVDPGKLVAVKKRTAEKPIDLSRVPVTKTVAGPRVQLKQYKNRHWQLLVDGKPFPIRCVTYSITPVGASPDRGTWDVSRDWQLLDTDKNGVWDGDQAFVDTNGNNVQDGDEPTVGDPKLLADMGVNTLRCYHHVYNKELFRRLFKEHGFYILCGDLLGAYAVGSGATWQQGTDYSNPQQQATMLASVKQMVMDVKDEPYVLMYVLGNENIYGVANNADKNPEAFYSMVNKAAELIHQLDPSRPVALANGDLLHLDVFAKYCPAVDVLGANAYRGEQGFGKHLFQAVRDIADRPVLITEYGCSAYGEGYSQEQADAYQAMYLGNAWEDLEANMAGRGVGNALGGVMFEFMDEWWKANSDLPEKVQKARPEWYAARSATYKSLQPENHDTVPQFGFPFIDGWSYEEWYGVVSQGNGKNSPFVRQLRPAYATLKEMWKK